MGHKFSTKISKQAKRGSNCDSVQWSRLFFIWRLEGNLSQRSSRKRCCIGNEDFICNTTHFHRVTHSVHKFVFDIKINYSPIKCYSKVGWKFDWYNSAVLSGISQPNNIIWPFRNSGPLFLLPFLIVIGSVWLYLLKTDTFFKASFNCYLQVCNIVDKSIEDGSEGSRLEIWLLHHKLCGSKEVYFSNYLFPYL